MRSRKFLFNLLAILFLLGACDEAIEPFENSDDFQYFPLAVGNEWYYQQTDINYEVSGIDTIYSEVKEEVISLDTTADNVMRFTMQRSSRLTSQDEWNVDSVYYVKRSDDWILTQLGYEVYTTLNFPITTGKQWNYYSHSTNDDQIASYQSDSVHLLRQSTFDGLFESDEHILVLISDVSNIIIQDEQYELFLKDVGLIEKKSIILNFCTNCQNSFQINSGSYMLKQLTSYVIN
jgi:hypothetical protein